MEYLAVGHGASKKIKHRRMKYFVFVVCGARKHIETLNFSLKFIRHFSKYPVLVVTDTARNEIPVEHDQIIHIETPVEYDHHQASIYLKTGLHRFLDIKNSNLYCYLDSDIVSINSEINSIFDHYLPPIIFARDHCTFDEFSPHAMQCNCLADIVRRNNEYKAVDEFFRQQFFLKIKENLEDKTKLDMQFELLKRKKITNILPAVNYYFKRYFLPVKKVRLGRYYFNKNDGFWYNLSGDIIHFDWYYAVRILEKNGVRYNKKTGVWKNSKGEDIMPQVPHCRHLGEYLSRNYEIEIPGNWRHWNGGVFIFNERSCDFMNYWHKITIDEFNNLKTKTRDQGTLAVSAWKFGLQEAPILDKKFNFIAEYNDPEILYAAGKGFTFDQFKSTFEPCFLHIYHEWGHSGWSIWDYVAELGEKNQIL